MWTRKQEGGSACRFPALVVGNTANNVQHAIEANTDSITNIVWDYVLDLSTNVVMYKVKCFRCVDIDVVVNRQCPARASCARFLELNSYGAANHWHLTGTTWLWILWTRATHG